MPLPGILASSYRSAAGPAGAYDSLASVIIGAGGASSVVFSGIPTNYKHLEISYIARTNRANTIDAMDMQFNSDSTITNYMRHSLEGTGAAIAASSSYPQSGNYPFWIAYCPGANMTANIFGGGTVTILDYAHPSKYKTSHIVSGYDGNSASSGYAEVSQFSHLWMNNSPITTVTILPSLGTSFSQYSKFSVYGIK